MMVYIHSFSVAFEGFWFMVSISSDHIKRVIFIEKQTNKKPMANSLLN